VPRPEGQTGVKGESCGLEAEGPSSDFNQIQMLEVETRPLGFPDTCANRSANVRH
jgi:hypothetical protein